MRVKITFTLNSNPENKLEDIVRWPDLSKLDEVGPYAEQHLAEKHGADTFSILAIEEA